jgi:histidyl-tRNA synthetase
MKKADASGAAFAVILGDDEIANHVAAVKAMRGNAGDTRQATVPFDEVVDYLVDQIVGDDHDHDHVHYHH